jgi:hypothetical protein
VGKKVSVNCGVKFSWAVRCEVIFSIQWPTFGQNTAPRACVCSKHAMWLCRSLHPLMMKTACEVFDTNSHS